MTPAIYIVGAQCSGKTTLAVALREYFSSDPSLPAVTLLTEAARDILKRHHFTRKDIRESRNRCMELQKLILEGQFTEERKIMHNSMLISDRSGIDPIVYAAKYGCDAGTKLLLASLEWHELRGRMASSVVVVCEPVEDWLKDDGVRLMPKNAKEWIEIHQSFCDHLEGANIQYCVLPADMTSLRDRVQFVASQWRKRLENLRIENEMKRGKHDMIVAPAETSQPPERPCTTGDGICTDRTPSS